MYLSKKYLVFLLTLATFSTFSYNAFGQCSSKSLKRMKKLHSDAMDDYDQMEFASARKTLEDAISMARRVGCDEVLEYANILVDLGIIYITDSDNPDESRGKGRFRKALKVNPCAKIKDSLKTPRLQRLLNKVRKSMGLVCKKGTSSSNSNSSNSSSSNSHKKVDIDEEDTGSEPSKLEHSVPDEAPAESNLKIKCRAPKKGGIKKVVVYFRKPGESDYTAKQMENYSGYSWKVIIPGSEIKGAIFQYYIAALGKNGKVLMANGNSGAPNIITLTKPVKKSDGGSEEDPLNPNKKKDDGNSETPKTTPDHKGKKWIFKLGARWGAGFLSTTMCSSLAPDTNGTCDGAGTNVANPGFAYGELGGEIGVHRIVSKSLSLGVDIKSGFVTSDYAKPGENDKGVGAMALLKANYFLLGFNETFRPYVGGILGGGITFHQWEVDEAQGKSDTFQHGFLMVGGAFGFLVGSPTVSFYFNLDGILIAPQQTTFHLDITAGLAISF